MKKKQVLILDKETIAHKLRRMAYEIWERNSDERELVLVGIEKGGKILADNLTTILREISPLEIHCLSISINKKKPLNHAIEVEENLEGRCVILVDDVINSGKTMLYSLHAILSYDLKKLMVAVLVDRKHGRPVKKLELRSEDGRLLAPEDTQLLLATAVGGGSKVL